MCFGVLRCFGFASFLYLQLFVVAFVLCVFGSASFIYLQCLAVLRVGRRRPPFG